MARTVKRLQLNYSTNMLLFDFRAFEESWDLGKGQKGVLILKIQDWFGQLFEPVSYTHLTLPTTILV